MKNVTISFSAQGSADDGDIEKVRDATEAVKKAAQDAGLTVSAYFSPDPQGQQTAAGTPNPNPGVPNPNPGLRNPNPGATNPNPNPGEPNPNPGPRNPR